MNVKLHFFYKIIWHIANYILTLHTFLTKQCLTNKILHYENFKTYRPTI